MNYDKIRRFKKKIQRYPFKARIVEKHIGYKTLQNQNRQLFSQKKHDKIKLENTKTKKKKTAKNSKLKTENTLAKRNIKSRQSTVDQTLHSKLMVVQRETHSKTRQKLVN